jgi:hypothetical protein
VSTVNQELSDAQKNIQLLQQQMNAQGTCQRNSEIDFQIQSLDMYLSHIVNQAGANCGTSNSTKVVYVPSSQNNFYVYGSQTQQTYLANLQNLLSQGYTKIECPVATPFPNGSSCVSCIQDGAHYYDLTTNLCMACQPGYMFQPVAGACLP